jgi:hypothetical protein
VAGAGGAHQEPQVLCSMTKLDGREQDRQEKQQGTET